MKIFICGAVLIGE